MKHHSHGLIEIAEVLHRTEELATDSITQDKGIVKKLKETNRRFMVY